MTPLEDILSRRSKFSKPIKTPHNFITFFYGQPVAVLAFEPDPASHHGMFYYNSRDNVLFKKLHTAPFPVWKPVGN